MFRMMPPTYPTGVGTIGPRKWCADLVSLPKAGARQARPPRGCDTNSAYLYERIAGETEHEHADEPGLHVLRRGASREAAQLVRTIIATHDDQARTAHDIAADAAYHEQLPERVHSLLTRRANAVQRRQVAYQHWQDEDMDLPIEGQGALDQTSAATEAASKASIRASNYRLRSRFMALGGCRILVFTKKGTN